MAQQRVRGDRSEQQRGEQGDATVATEAAVRLEVQVADEVVAPAGPHPVRPRLVRYVGVEDAQKKREKGPHHHAECHESTLPWPLLVAAHYIHVSLFRRCHASPTGEDRKSTRLN